MTVEKGTPFKVKHVQGQGEKEVCFVPGVCWGGGTWSPESWSAGEKQGRLKTPAPGRGDLFAFRQQWEFIKALCGRDISHR